MHIGHLILPICFVFDSVLGAVFQISKDTGMIAGKCIYMLPQSLSSAILILLFHSLSSYNLVITLKNIILLDSNSWFSHSPIFY